MRVFQQTTIAQSVSVSGAALHSGAMTRATLKPADIGAGIVFRRVDTAEGAYEIGARIAALSGSRRATTIANPKGQSLSTVEHALAALSLCSVDNVLIEVEGTELPILDGSAAPWVDAIERAGVKPLPAAREALRIISAVEVADGDRFIRAEPSNGRMIEVEIDFEDAAIGRYCAKVDLGSPVDRRRVAAARTFCRLADVERLRACGLSLGGSVENAIVVDGARILNPEGLRDPQEFALHKILDMVGDFALAGAPLIGHIRARKPGHDLNARFISQILERCDAVERIMLGAVAERLPA